MADAVSVAEAVSAVGAVSVTTDGDEEDSSETAALTTADRGGSDVALCDAVEMEAPSIRMSVMRTRVSAWRWPVLRR